MVTRTFDTKSSTLHIKYSGEVDFKTMLAHLDEVSKIKLPKRIKILTEVCESHFVFNSTDVLYIWEKFKIIFAQQESIYDAIIISNPRETALNILFKEISKQDPVSTYKSKVFSTYAAAQAWLEEKS